MASGTITGSGYAGGHYWLEIGWSSSQNVSANTSSVTATLYLKGNWGLDIGSRSGTITINGSSKSITSSAVSASSGSTWSKNLGSYTTTVAHNSDGTKSITISGSWTMSASISGYGTIGTMTVSGTANLGTIPRTASISSVSNANVGSNTTITWTPPSSSFSFRGYVKYGSNTQYGSKTSAGATSTTVSIPSTWIASGTSGTATAYLETYSGTTLIGTTSKTFTISVPNYTPNAPTLSISKTAKLSGYFLAGVDTATVTVTASATQYGGSISTTYVRTGSASGTVVKSASGETASYSTGTLSSSTTYYGNYIDSHSKTSNSASGTISVTSYSAPKISSFTVTRLSSPQTTARLTVNGSYTNITGNTLTVRVQYKASSATSWTTLSGTTTLGTSRDVTGFAVNTTYNWRVTLTDTVGKTVTQTATLPTTSVTMDFRDGGTGVSFGKLSERSSAVESAWSIYLTNTGRGLSLTDKNGATYGGICDNGSNLWIGATGSDTNHHVGQTFISSGYSGSAGYSSVQIAVPNSTNTGASTYPILHTGNYDNYLDPRYYPANGKTSVSAPNCNSYTTIGQAIYWSNGASVTNGPSDATTSGSGKVAGRLTVEGTLGSGTYLRQVYREYNNNKRWERYSTNTGSSWSSWARIDGWAMQYNLALSIKNTKTSTVNIAAGGTQWFYLGGSTAPYAADVDGRICAIGWYVTGTNATLCIPYAQTNASVALKNTSTSQATGIAVTFYCLCNA